MKTAGSLSDKTSTKVETLQTFLLDFEGEKKCVRVKCGKGSRSKQEHVLKM